MAQSARGSESIRFGFAYSHKIMYNIDTSAELDQSFIEIGRYGGAHMVLDTSWEYFLAQNFDGFSIQKLMEGLYQKSGDISVLDEGCGSSITIFEAIEDIERKRETLGAVNGYGITASTGCLVQPVPDFLKSHVLESTDATGLERRRLELL